VSGALAGGRSPIVIDGEKRGIVTRGDGSFIAVAKKSARADDRVESLGSVRARQVAVERLRVNHEGQYRAVFASPLMLVHENPLVWR